MQKPILSKSTFLRGLQCHKSLYLYKNHYDLKDDISLSQQAIFDQGTRVGELAQNLFPNGVDASPEDYFKLQESVFKTKAFIEKGEAVIYEATFQYNEVIVAVDILVKDDEGWKAFEVKSSTEVKPVNLDDATIQYYTILNSGIDLKDISIVHINNQYTRQGAIDVNQLFTIASVLNEVKLRLPKIPTQIETFKNVIWQSNSPNIDIGPHCNDPYGCDFKGYCWKHIPEYSVFNISRLNQNKKFQMYEEGIVNFEDIDLNNNNLNGNQLLQVTSELHNETHINRKLIKVFLNELRYPLYFLDFETINPAVPIYDNSRPYQQLVFQYSLHVQHEVGGEVDHFEYLASANPSLDPRIGFVQQLIKDCGTSGDILVYNIGFEKGKLNDLMAIYPQYSNDIQNIISRLKDLMVPFQKKWYYTPEMKGSYSIKAVLPALVPELSYADLEIQEGGTASSVFTQMVNGHFKGDIESTRTDLLEYCKLDTYAMVKILEKLNSIN